MSDTLSDNAAEKPHGGTEEEDIVPTFPVFVETLRFISQQKIIQSLLAGSNSRNVTSCDIEMTSLENAKTGEETGAIDDFYADEDDDNDRDDEEKYGNDYEQLARHLESPQEAAAQDAILLEEAKLSQERSIIESESDSSDICLLPDNLDLSECVEEGYFGRLDRFVLIRNLLKLSLKLKQEYQDALASTNEVMVVEEQFNRRYPIMMEEAVSYRNNISDTNDDFQEKSKRLEQSQSSSFSTGKTDLEQLETIFQVQTENGVIEAVTTFHSDIERNSDRKRSHSANSRREMSEKHVKLL